MVALKSQNMISTYNVSWLVNTFEMGKNYLMNQNSDFLNVSQNFWPTAQQYDMSHIFQQTLNDEIYALNILLKSHHLLLKISYKNVIHNFVSLHFHFWGIWASIVIPEHYT